ncbi:MAG: DUF2076 family protein [Pseudomonadota bacterium]
MTSQEYQLLQDFLNQLTQVRGTVKDPEAEALIAKAVVTQPDAAYLLVQRAMLLEQALNSAKAQITQLQNQTSLNAGGGSFLSSSGWGNAQSQPPVAAPPSAPTPAVAPPANAQPGLFNSGAGSFLGSVAATAAGVAGGAFLFYGIGNLLGHHGNNEAQGQNTAPNKLADNTTNDHKEGNNDSSQTDDSLDDLGPSDDDSWA